MLRIALGTMQICAQGREESKERAVEQTISKPRIPKQYWSEETEWHFTIYMQKKTLVIDKHPWDEVL